MLAHPVVRLGRMALEKYQRDDVGGLAAALSYHTIFSLFPLLLVTISLVGFVVNPAQFDVQQQFLSIIGSPELRTLIIQTLGQFQANRVGTGLIGLATLLFGATGIFSALDHAFDVIWEARGGAGGQGLRATVTGVALDRLIAFGLLLMCAGLIVAAILGNLAIGLLGSYTDWLPHSNLLMDGVRQALTIALIAVALAVIYRALPRPHAVWGDVWVGAFVAAVLLALLQALAGFIFSLINFSAYGAIGGAMTLLMWIFFCAQIILIGGEIAHAWAHIFGSRQAA